jgi:hypothetical protein
MNACVRRSWSQFWHRRLFPSCGDLSVKPLAVRMPYDETNKIWLGEGRGFPPVWDRSHRCWLLSRSCFSELVERLLRRFCSAYVVQPYEEMEKCARSCWEARGLECECQCMGEYHGSEMPGGRWYEVSDTFALRWQNAGLRCALLTLKAARK